MAKIKPLGEISQKWKTVTPGRQEQYKDGVRGAGSDWESGASGAESSYEAGIQQAISDKRYGKGIRKVGGTNWEDKTLAKGPVRWAQGVSISASDYEAGFAPFREVIANLKLPPRGPTGDPNNIQRVAAIADALHKAKLARGKGGS